MVVGDAGFEAVFAVGSAEASGVGELQAEEEVVGGVGATLFAVAVEECLGEALHGLEVFGSVVELVWVGPALGDDGEGFAAPDELGSGESEVSPASNGVLRGGAVGFGVPAFHWMDAPAVADGAVAYLDRLGQGGTFGGREDLIVAGESGGDLFEVLAELLDGFETADALEVDCHVTVRFLMGDVWFGKVTRERISESSVRTTCQGGGRVAGEHWLLSG